MVVTLLGIIIESRLLQLLNARLPIFVTLLGTIVLLQPAIKVLEAVSIIALQLSRLSYIVFKGSTTIDFRLMHPSITFSLIIVTLFGIVIDSKLVQAQKVP